MLESLGFISDEQKQVLENDLDLAYIGREAWEDVKGGVTNGRENAVTGRSQTAS